MEWIALETDLCRVLLSGGCSLLAFGLLHFLMRLLFGPIPGGRGRRLLAYGLLGGLWALGNGALILFYQVAFVNLLIALVLCLFYQGPYFSKCLVASLAIYTQYIVVYIAYKSLFFLGGLRYCFWQAVASNLISYLFLAVINSILYLRAKKRRLDINVLPSGWQLFFGVLFFLSSLLLYFINEMSLQIWPSSNEYPLTLVTSCILMLLEIVILAFLFYVTNHFKIHTDVLLSRQKIADQSLFYQQIMAKSDEQRRTIHDATNYLLGISGYLRQNDVQKAQQAVSQMLSSLHIAEVPDTGLPALNGILAEKIHQAQEAGIRFSCLPAIYGQLSVNDMDLALIIANGLDNAIEAVQQLPEPEQRYIYCTISLQKDNILIEIENPVAQDIAIDGCTLPTTKPDAAAHGIGLSSVRAIAQKYDGSCYIRCQDKCFVLQVALQNKPAH